MVEQFISGVDHVRNRVDIFFVSPSNHLLNFGALRNLKYALCLHIEI